VAHSTLLLLQTVESVVFTGFLLTRHVEQRQYSDASDNALYWYFLTLSWVPLYVVVFLTPYVM